MAENKTYCSAVFRESSSGNDYADDRFVSASGYYVDWDDESVIGLHLASGATQSVLGTNVVKLMAANTVEKTLVMLPSVLCAWEVEAPRCVDGVGASHSSI